MSLHPSQLQVGLRYLVESSERGVLALKELSEQEHKLARDASENLHGYHYHRRREREVMMNYSDFIERYEFYELKAIKEDYKEKHEFFVTVYIDLNRLLTNFLSSFRLLVDNFQIYLKKKYGEQSREYLKFKNLTIYEFNSKFEYRLLYRLRNYAHHKGFPIKSVGVDVDKITERAPVFRVSFDKDQLVKDDSDSFKHLLSDFAMSPRLIPVLPIISKIKASLEVIRKAIIEIEKPTVVAQTNILLKYLDLREDNGNIGFAVFQQPSTGVGLLDSFEIPINILREVYFDIEGNWPAW